MKKIASPQELQSEIRSILAFIHGHGPEGKPARQVVADKLRELADRVAGYGFEVAPASSVEVGDFLVEQDGSMLEVTDIQRSGSTVTFVTKGSGMIGMMRPTRVRATTKVRVRRRRAELADRLAVGQELLPPSKAASAEKAFEYELLPWLANQIGAVLKNTLDKQMLGIQKGKWPDSRLEYAVTRYRPLDETPEEFLEDVVDYYLDWRRGLKQLLQKG